MKTMVLSIVVILINVIQKQVAVLVISPRDTEVKVNDTTYLNCSTSLATSVHWRQDRWYIYTGSGILEPYNERFTVERNSSTGAYNLVIRSVRHQDAGEYQCQDDEGFGESRSAQLTVLDNDPVCAFTSNMHPDGVVGPNSCGVKPEKIQLSCSLKYLGSIPPTVEWRKSGSSHSISEGVGVYRESNYLNSTLIVDSVSDSDLDGSSFICQTTRAIGRQHSCSYGVIKVLYVLSGSITRKTHLGEEIDCIANSSQVCTYKWIWFSGENSATMSNSSTFTPTSVGQHRCEATCVLRNTFCAVTVMLVDVQSTTAGRGILLGLLVVSVMISGLCDLLLIFWIKNRRLQPVITIEVHLPGCLTYRVECEHFNS